MYRYIYIFVISQSVSTLFSAVLCTTYEQFLQMY